MKCYQWLFVLVALTAACVQGSAQSGFSKRGARPLLQPEWTQRKLTTSEVMIALGSGAVTNRATWTSACGQAMLRTSWLQQSRPSSVNTVGHKTRHNDRTLLAGFSSNQIQVAFSSTTAVCPNITGGDWAEIAGLGHLVSDNWVCYNPSRPAQAHGGSTQDYSTKPAWETYGWAAFNVPAAPTGSSASKARLEGLSLHVLGNMGLGGSGTCKVEAVDIAIYTDSGGAPDTEQYSANLLLPGDAPGSSTFTWTSNSSSVLSFDVVDLHPGNTLNPNKLELAFAATYWLRVKMLVPYGGDSGNAKCFINWALNNVSKTGRDCLWQEAAGGAAGYSTSCTGATTGVLPWANQTFASCFNGGAPGSTGTRRCWSYRKQVSTPITCPAQFRDFNFAFYGFNAANCSAAPTSTLSNGSWPTSCAGKRVGELCFANCTWGGSASTECLYTGSWSSAVNGTCADPPTNCSGAPTAALSDGTWPANCSGTLIGGTCGASCQFGGSSSVTCQANGQWEATTTGSCAAPPTSCAGAPTGTISNGAWPGSCAGAVIGAACSAACTYGGTANVTCLATGLWDTTITGSCNTPPTSCTGTPSATTSNGAWPGSCAGAAIGATCSATCTYGGTANVTCLATGLWNATVTGSCDPPPTSCAGTPTATISNGAWPGSCAGAAIGATCSATCTYGGTANVTCLATGLWDTTITGSCNTPPTSCAGTPTATISNGAWPGSCAGAAIGASCSATCTYGGTATVTCLATGLWSSSISGSCNAAPTSCSGTPSSNPSYGSWPASCSGTSIGQSCSATCTYGGSVTAACQSGGIWSGTFTGSCTPGATALISESGLLPLGSDRLRICNLTGNTFSNCVTNAGFNTLRASFAVGNTVWAADDGTGTVSVCSLSAQTNTLSGCTSSSLTGFSGMHDPVAVVVKDGVAFVANRDSACGVIGCTDAATMTGCSCALTSAQNARTVRGIALSPAGDKLYFTSNTNGANYGIVVCALSGTTIGTCTVYNSGTILTGVFVNDQKLYVVARFVNLALTYARVWVCDPNTPDPSSNCVQTGTVFGTGVLANDPWGLSVFDGVAYVPDNSAVQRCSNTNDVSSCSTGGGLLSLSPLLSGASSIFILPQV